MSPLLIEELARQRQAEIAEEFTRIYMVRKAKKHTPGFKIRLKTRFLYLTGKFLIDIGNRIHKHCQIDNDCLNANKI